MKEIQMKKSHRVRVLIADDYLLIADAATPCGRKEDEKDRRLGCLHTPTARLKGKLPRE
jgi:hypothetical protein